MGYFEGSGGSSSGCGAAVGAGLVPLALGTDTAGSIRNPAAWCGVTGLKPTYLRIPLGGVMQLAPTLDHIGLLARTAEDCLILLRSLEGVSEDPHRAGDASLRHLRIAKLATRDRNESLSDEETRLAYDSACDVLTDLGAKLVDVDWPWRDVERCARTIHDYEAYHSHRPNLITRPHDYGSRCLRLLGAGASISTADYDQALQNATCWRAQLSQLYGYDAVVSPTVAFPACRLHDEEKLAEATRSPYRISFNLLGNPAASICIGFSRAGLPLAMQIVGQLRADELVLSIASAYQTATQWQLKHPKLGRMTPP